MRERERGGGEESGEQLSESDSLSLDVFSKNIVILHTKDKSGEWLKDISCFFQTSLSIHAK